MTKENRNKLKAEIADRKELAEIKKEAKKLGIDLKDYELDGTVEVKKETPTIEPKKEIPTVEPKKESPTPESKKEISGVSYEQMKELIKGIKDAPKDVPKDVPTVAT